jgi:hypothetical protein
MLYYQKKRTTIIMKKLFKYLFISVVILALAYCAAWYYGKNLLSSALNDHHQGKNFIIKNLSKDKPNFIVSGFPFGYTITSTTPANFQYQKLTQAPVMVHLSGLNLQIRFSSKPTAHLNLSALKAYDTQLKFGESGVLELNMSNINAQGTVSNIFASPALKAEATMADAGIGGANNPCLTIKDGKLTYTMTKQNAVINQDITLNANPSFQTGCQKLFAQQFQPVMKLIPFKKADSNLKGHATIKKDELSKKQTIQMNLAAQDKKGKDVFTVKSDLLNDPLLNKKGAYDGSITIMIKRASAALSQKKLSTKSKPADFFKALASEVLKPLNKGKVKEGHVLEFVVRNNVVDLDPKTLQNLATSFLDR